MKYFSHLVHTIRRLRFGQSCPTGCDDEVDGNGVGCETGPSPPFSRRGMSSLQRLSSLSNWPQAITRNQTFMRSTSTDFATCRTVLMFGKNRFCHDSHTYP